MILFTICVVAVLVGLFFYLRDMGLLGGPNRDPIRGGVVPEIPPTALDSIRDTHGSSSWDEVKHMRDMQDEVYFDIVGYWPWQHDNKDTEPEDSGVSDTLGEPDCD